MSDIRRAFFPMIRSTLIGTMCSMIPGTGPTIASFVSYATEKKISKTPERFGRGAIEGVASPEASTHSAVQGDFISTMSFGIPGDSVMALLLGALMIKGIVPGPQLIKEHPDIFWDLIASFWLGNMLLVMMSVCLIPGFDGAFLSRGWKEALWARFYTAAPPRLRRSVARYSTVKKA